MLGLSKWCSTVNDHIWICIGPGKHLLLRICTVHGFNVDAAARLCCATGEQPEWRAVCPIMFTVPTRLRRLALNPLTCHLVATDRESG